MEICIFFFVLFFKIHNYLETHHRWILYLLTFSWLWSSTRIRWFSDSTAVMMLQVKLLFLPHDSGSPLETWLMLLFFYKRAGCEHFTDRIKWGSEGVSQWPRPGTFRHDSSVQTAHIFLFVTSVRPVFVSAMLGSACVIQECLSIVLHFYLWDFVHLPITAKESSLSNYWTNFWVT